MKVYADTKLTQLRGVGVVAAAGFVAFVGSVRGQVLMSFEVRAHM